MKAKKGNLKINLNLRDNMFGSSKKITKLKTGFATMYKGNLIAKCLYGVIVWTKKPTKFFPGVLP